jgi:hypothetical protein
MPPNDHSDLEAVPQAHDPTTQKYLYDHSSDLIPKYANPIDGDSEKIALEPLVQEIDRPKTICGLRKRAFWIVFIIAVIVIAAAVAGGVGGVLATRSGRSETTSPETAISTSTPASIAASRSSSSSSTAPPSSLSAPPPSSSSTPTSTSPPSLSTTTLIGPSSTILRDCPSSNNTLYSVTTGSTPQHFRKLCGNTYPSVQGVRDAVSTVVASLDECINLCAAYNVRNRTRIQAGEDSVCNSVCWRNTFERPKNDWEGGRCFGFLTQEVTSGGAGEEGFRAKVPAEDRCDSAALIGGAW